jgi:hypothetical protein
MCTSILTWIAILAIVTGAIFWPFGFDRLFGVPIGGGKINLWIFLGLILGIAIFYRLHQLYHSAKQKINPRNVGENMLCSPI